MPELSELVVIVKPDEPKLKIHRSALAEHLRLGWKQVAEQPEEVSAPVSNKKTEK